MKFSTLTTFLLLGLQGSLAMEASAPAEKTTVTFDCQHGEHPFKNQYSLSSSNGGEFYTEGQTTYTFHNHPEVETIHLSHFDESTGLAHRNCFFVNISYQDDKESLKLHKNGDVCAMVLDTSTNRRWLTALNATLEKENTPLPAQACYHIFHSMGTGTPEDGALVLNEWFDKVDLDNSESIDVFKESCITFNDPIALAHFLTLIGQETEYFTHPGFKELYISLYDLANKGAEPLYAMEKSLYKTNAYHIRHSKNLRDDLKKALEHIAYFKAAKYFHEHELLQDSKEEEQLSPLFTTALSYAFEANNQELINKLVQIHCNPSSPNKITPYNGPDIKLDIETIAYLTNQIRNLNK